MSKTLITILTFCLFINYCEEIVPATYTNYTCEDPMASRGDTYIFSELVTLKIRQEVSEAFAQWSKASGMLITESAIQPRILIRYEALSTEIDGYQPMGAVIEMGQYTLLVINSEAQMSNRELKTTALHEVGHIFGVAHNINEGSIMRPLIGSVTELSEYDLGAAKYCTKKVK